MIGCFNPFNIKYSPLNRWKGQVGQTKGFCNFSDLSFGVRAAAYLLMISYRKKGIVTYGKIIQTFAPASENNTSAYITFVCNSLHVFPFDVVKTIGNYCGLLHYMSVFEVGHASSVSASYCREIINHYKFTVKDYK